MLVGVKIPPVAQLLNGVGCMGISGFGNSFCEKKNTKIQVFVAPREQLNW